MDSGADGLDGGMMGPSVGDGSSEPPFPPGDGDGTGDGDATGDGDGPPPGDGDGNGDGDGSADGSVPGDGDQTGDGDGDGDGEPNRDAAVPDAGPPPSFTPPEGAVGAPCEQSSQCDGFGNTCLQSVERNGEQVPVPNGYCTHTCNLIIDCGMNERCLDDANVCVRTCESSADCRAAEGFVCDEGVCTLPD